MDTYFLGYVSGWDAIYPQTPPAQAAWLRSQGQVCAGEMPAPDRLVREEGFPLAAGKYFLKPAPRGSVGAGQVKMFLSSSFKNDNGRLVTPDGTLWRYRRVDQPNYYSAGESHLEKLVPYTKKELP